MMTTNSGDSNDLLVLETDQQDLSRNIQSRDLLHRILAEPEKFIDNLFDEVTNHGQEMHGDWVDRFTKIVHSVFSEADIRDLYKIPLLNAMDEKEMLALNGQVVRFRGMVQELYDPVLTRSFVTIKNLCTGESREKCLLFSDGINLGNNQAPIDDTSNQGLHEMELINCISVPGENKWVMQVDAAYKTNSESSVNGEIEEDCSVASTSSSNGTNYVSDAKTRAMFGFPLKSMVEDPSCKAVIGKIYRHPNDIVMNDVLDLYGILTVDQSVQGDAEIHQDINESVDGAESLIRNPLDCIIPRLSILGYSKKCSFELPRILLTVQQLDQMRILDDWQHPIREDLTEIFTQSCLGDTLCARYIMMNLLSNVNARVGGSPIGSFPVCITGIPVEISRFINTVIQNLVPRSVYLENFLGTIENECYIPWKDYGCDKFMSGILQLSSGTHLILEELDIPEQQQRNLQKSVKGLRNLTALQKLIEWQAVDYDFKYQAMEFLHDVPVLILSSSQKTIFANTIRVPFKPILTLDFFESHAKPRILGILENTSRVSHIRDFIVQAKKNVEFKISPAMEDIIGKDFSEQRKVHGMDADELSICLTHARYWLKIKGTTELTEDFWMAVRSAERQRKSLVMKA